MQNYLGYQPGWKQERRTEWRNLVRSAFSSQNLIYSYLKLLHIPWEKLGPPQNIIKPYFNCGHDYSLFHLLSATLCRNTIFLAQVFSPLFYLLRCNLNVINFTNFKCTVLLNCGICVQPIITTMVKIQNGFLILQSLLCPFVFHPLPPPPALGNRWSV